MPTFGAPIAGLPYVVRPSAYALIRNGSWIAIVRSPRGYFLPGGGIEPGETAAQTVAREAKEECGLEITSASSIGSATEIIGSKEENACFEKRCEFLIAKVISISDPLEADHQLVWASEESAAEILTFESHRWAVAQFRPSQRCS